MRVLVACEFSGTVRRAFRRLGADAWSCDLLPAEDNDQHHIQVTGNGLLDSVLVPGRWDLMIAHQPCTHLAVSGARWFKDKVVEQAEAVAFFLQLAEAPVPRKCIENPVSIMSTRYRKPDQIIQPWQFGHGETKATCLWLTNLPLLRPTQVVEGREARIHRMPPSADRWKLRSTTYPGIADAMAQQWGAA